MCARFQFLSFELIAGAWFARLTIVLIFSESEYWNIVITMESFATETSPAVAIGSNPRVNDFLTHETFG